ncbi:uncharacterized protein TRIVIDRAFT_199191 [Trichoderma virens Gv29-8]|uniref:Secreted protein n=1 Tax=Hypocrea virens (strain Gv29-8 / FGSC 10586) TaxID=413071 RepID=G9MMM1_HYPVG|nr:uncharacterized protein TRIVIDRAFT_199191 [Trichoderma virens Gv29-8]EHK24589.1 hypothetical protein TRIVIDRAFT_199191 [Trichoderma virens Gv29-8]
MNPMALSFSLALLPFCCVQMGCIFGYRYTCLAPTRPTVSRLLRTCTPEALVSLPTRMLPLVAESGASLWANGKFHVSSPRKCTPASAREADEPFGARHHPPKPTWEVPSPVEPCS